MNKYNGYSKMWFLALLLVAFVAGCASNAQEIPIIPDTIRPTVSFTAPASGDVAVPFDRKVYVAFSEAMDPLTITSATFTVTGPGLTPVSGTVAYVGTTATFTPTSNFANSTLYTATITTGAKDLAGNALASNYGWKFTTGAAADTIAPTVSVTSPTNTAVAVPINRKINIAFSEAMDPSTISTATFTVTGPGVTPVTGTVTPVGTSATFTPTGNLANSTLYTATISTGSKDLAGNAMASNFVFTFTTGIAADTIAPTVSVTSPTNTAVAVPINRKVTVGFSEAMDPSTITTATFTVTGPGGTPVAGTVVPVGTSATFTPTGNLANSTIYTATISTGAKDLAGNPMAINFVFIFTTGAVTDITKPTVIATINANNAINVPTNTKVGATFSEVMDPLTITSATFTLKQGATDIPGTVAYSGVTMVFTPASVLATGTLYTATITTGAKDLAGNALAGNQAPLPAASNYVWSFTTGTVTDVIAPLVISTIPLDLATGVATNSVVTATFSEAMDPLNITTATYTVKDTLTGINVPGTVSFGGTSATFTPQNILAISTNYTATIKGGIGGVTDLAGNALAVDNVWSFTTANIIAPPVVSQLGSAATFGIMATLAITNTGPSMVNGDVSLNPGTSNGLLPAQVNGAIHINDAVSAQAKLDLLAAFNHYTNLAPGTTVPGGFDLGAFVNGGLPGVLPPGTYTSGSTMLVSTPIHLNGTATDVWVFQIGSSLTTTANVILGPGVLANNVFWVPALDATIGVNSIFSGTIVAGRDATGKTGAVINGRILAGATNPGTIALDTNTVNVPAP
jgi:Ice-binding-like/Bacterial Ig-like domain